MLVGNCGSLSYNSVVIAVVHIGEARPELLDICSNERVGHKVDMVGNDHQIAHPKAGVDTARSVRHK